MIRKGVLAAVLAGVACANLLGSTVTGKATDAKGMPVPRVQLLLFNLETVRKIPLATDARGGFTMELEPGEYSLYSVDAGAARLLIAQLRVLPSTPRYIDLRVDARGEISAETKDVIPPLGEAHRPQPAEQIDPTLATIRDFQIQPSVSARAGSPAARPLSDVVNPFAAAKGGRFHGSVYEFHRNDNFDARNFFDPVGQKLPEYKRNQFGATFGTSVGRSVKLFGTYEGLRIVQGSTLLSHVPTAAMKRGDFGDLSVALRDPATGAALGGNRIPDSRIHPVSRRLLDLLPDPNRNDPDRNFVNNQPIVRNRNTVSFRFDYSFAQGSNLFARYLIGSESNSLVSTLPRFGSIQDERDQTLMISDSHRLTDRWLATWHVEYARVFNLIGSVNAGKSGLLSSLGIAGLAAVDATEEGYPDFQLSGYAAFGDAQVPRTSTTNRLTADGSLSYSPTNHSVQLGAGIVASQANNFKSDGLRRGRFSFNGYYSGDAFADFLFGVPDIATHGIGSDRADMRRKSWYVFARDQWKVGPKLGVSFGLTYNAYPPFYSVQDNISGFHPLLVEPPRDGEIVLDRSPRARELGLPDGLVAPDRNDWAPNLGISFRPMRNNRLVLRGSYGISYAPLGSGSYSGYLGRNFPYYYIDTAQAPIDVAALDLSTPFTTAVRAELGVRGIEPRFRTGYVESWQASVQTELFQHWSLEASYKGARGTRLARVVYGNIPRPGPGDLQPRRPNPDFGRFTFLSGSGSSTRHAAELAAERRLASGISLKSGFTWNRMLSDVYSGFPSNPRNLRAERGPDSVPVRDFFLNYIVDLPVGRGGKVLRNAGRTAQVFVSGWRFSGITHLQSGLPFDVSLAGDLNNDGLGRDRADRSGSGRLDPASRSINSWFAVGDFAEPAPYTFGNSGRNILTGPSFQNWDVSLIKQARFADGNLIEFRVELFNAFNQVNFELPYAVLGTSTFGKIFGAHRAREIELALRYAF